MTVRRLRKKQKGPWCSYCEVKTRAVYRGCGFTKFSCFGHLDNLQEDDCQMENRRLSEADYQTWYRL
jgi:hypothetical protein